MSKSSDHYTALGLTPEASMEEIKRAFRALARECHPDVAGDAPGTVERFKRIKAAYDVLSDPDQRARYDRSRQRRSRPAHTRGPRMPGGFYFWGEGEAPPSADEPGPGRDPGNDLDLEDIFGDHGGFVDFGFGGKGNARPNQGSHGSAEARPGRDIALTVDVPADVARSGGTVTVSYVRQRRSDDGRSSFRYDELYDLRLFPGTRHGDSIRCPRMGHAGDNGGPYGDLICDVRVVGRATAEEPPPPPPPKATPPRSPPGEAAAESSPPRVVPISVQEALLGGRIELVTPQGPVVLNLPPCTSGGARFRLRGKGEVGPDGAASDLVVQLRVVMPPMLDDESYRLIERFAELNPYEPRKT